MTSTIAGLGAVARTTASRMHMLILAASVALAGLASSATPARSADTDDLIRFLLGAAAVAVIIGAIDDRHRPRYLGRWVLPASCKETARLRGRDVPVYNARCLRNAGYSGLPQRCYVNLRTNWGHRGSYVARCLYNAGYRAQTPVIRPPVVTPPSPGPFPGRILPQRCEMHYRQDGRRVWGYDGRCLYNAGYPDLPGACRVRDRAGNPYYNGSCLMNRGYRRAH